MRRKFEHDLSGKTCIVTGASSGIGREIALGLASMNAQVVLACRNEARGNAAFDWIKDNVPKAKLRLLQVDLSEKQSIQRAASEILEDHSSIDILVNNAGVWPVTKITNSDGHELTFATNVLGYYRLTHYLLDALKDGEPSRIINIASSFAGGLQLDDLHFEKRSYDAAKAYRQSKQANRMLTWALAKQLEGTTVTANAVHPGNVNTNLNRDFTGLKGYGFKIFFRMFGKSAADGADTAIYLASEPSLESTSGEFFAGRKLKSCLFRDDIEVTALDEYCRSNL